MPSNITQRRLHNSRLIKPSFGAPGEAVAAHGAMQAQDYGPAKWSIGQRSIGLVDADVDAALEAGTIVRTHVLRPTWHFVARDDLRWLLALTGPRVQQRNAPRYRDLGLDRVTLSRSEDVIGEALRGGRRLTRAALGEALDDAAIDRDGQRLPYILMHCELEAVICSGGLAGKQHTYALVDERVPEAGPFDREEALIELARRYLICHGPATAHDLSWWSGLTVADSKRSLGEVPEAHREQLGDHTFWSLDQDPAPPAEVRGVHLLQTWDEYIVGYSRSRFFGDPRARAAQEAWRSGGLPTGLVLLDGTIYGHWRRTIAKTTVGIEVRTYEDPEPGAVGALETAAAELGRFLGRRASLETSPT